MQKNCAQNVDCRDFLSVSRSLLLYGGAGAVGTAAHFMILFAALQWIEPVAASTMGAVAGCIINYFLARQFVFASTGSCRRSFPRFVTVALVGIGLNAIVINTFVDTLPIAINQAVASGLVLLLGYSLNRIWTFNEQKI